MVTNFSYGRTCLTDDILIGGHALQKNLSQWRKFLVGEHLVEGYCLTRGRFMRGHVLQEDMHYWWDCSCFMLALI